VETELEYRSDESKYVGAAQKRKIDPALKSWLDNVIVPAMVRQYLDSRENDGVSPTTERVQ